MAKKVKAGGLSAKVKGAVAAHKADDTNYGYVALPGGIQNGIAKLSAAKFDTYKSGTYEGEYYFRAEGIVVSPDAVNGFPVKGLVTSIMIPVCSTKKADGTEVSLEEHVAEVLNEMRKLGLDTTEMDDDALEEAAAELVEMSPYFRFSTTSGKSTPQYPTPRVFENWSGAVEYEGEEEGEDVEDETEEEEEPKPKATKAATAKKSSKKVVEEEAEEEEAEEEEAEEEEAEEVEYEDAEEEAEEFVPEKEEIYYYTPPNTRKKLECAVTAVQTKAQTVSLHCEDNARNYKGVPWSKLSVE